MAWDSHQIAEFNSHWQQSYVEVDGQLVYVEGVESLSDKTFSGVQLTGRGASIVTRRNKSFPMEEVKAKFMPVGYYDFTSWVLLFSHSPIVHTKRGVSSTNSIVGSMSLDATGNLVCSTNSQIEEKYLIEMYKQHKKVTKLDPDIFNTRLSTLLDSSINGFSLGRNYAAIPMTTRRGERKFVVVSLGGPIGTIGRGGVITLSPVVDYIADGLKNEIHKTYNKEVEINVAAR